MGRRGLYLFALGTVFMIQASFAQQAPGRVAPDGLLSDFGQQLDEMGIRVRSQIVDEYANNPAGGVRQGGVNVGQFQFGATFDLDKILGLPGGDFHITSVRDYGSSLALRDTGTFLKTQEIYKNAFPRWRLGVVAYEQKLFDDHLDIFVGRLGSTTFYGRLANSCFSESGLTCSVPQILNSEAGITFPTSATWGGNVKYKPVPGVYVEAGAFESDAFIQHTNGFDFSTANATGVSTFGEVAIGDFDLEAEPLPGDIKFGGYATTAPFNDPLYNTKGQIQVLKGGKPMVSPDLRAGAYIMGEKAVWRPDPTTNESASLFAGWIQPAEDEEVMVHQIYLGGVWRAPIAARPHDLISLTGSYFRLSPRELEFLDDARAKAGGKGDNSPNEYAFEADYNALLMPSVRLSPNIQYIVNPDNASIPNTKVLPQNALVLGVKLTVNIGGLLGLPLAPNLSD